MAKKQKPTTKIIAGKYKGKILDLPNLDITRSSKSILKESFFNVIQYDVIDTIFIEAFGGSGSIGLEAISRGAKKAHFIEIDNSSYRILQSNCKKIEPESCITIFGDTFVKLPEILIQQKNSKFPIILYVDPPFDFREDMEDIYSDCFDMISKIENNNIQLVTFEYATGVEMPNQLGKFTLFKTKKFGKSSLSYYRIEEE
jgi:16S rRNA (guanine(966)-N(2))-methyltransferase RsmD